MYWHGTVNREFFHTNDVNKYPPPAVYCSFVVGLKAEPQTTVDCGTN